MNSIIDFSPRSVSRPPRGPQQLLDTDDRKIDTHEIVGGSKSFRNNAWMVKRSERMQFNHHHHGRGGSRNRQPALPIPIPTGRDSPENLRPPSHCWTDEDAMMQSHHYNNSSSEDEIMEQMYNEHTWRMYHRIQSSFRSKKRSSSETLAVHCVVPEEADDSPVDQDCTEDYSEDHVDAIFDLDL